MKKAAFWMILLFVLPATRTRAQDDKFHEIGLNASPFFNQYLNLGKNDSIISSPYVLTYERKFGKLGIRAGVGAAVLRSTANTMDPANGQPALNSNQYGTASRLGVVLYKDLSKRWSLKYGFDLVYNTTNNKNWTVTTDLFGQKITNTTRSSTWRMGGGPFLFAQFHVGEHFSLGTEINAIFTSGENETSTESSAFPEFNTTNKTSLLQFDMSAPTALFLIFRF